jgi:type I restriction enzyme S subunit
VGEWREVPLGEVAHEVTVGFVGPMADQYRDGGIPFLRSQNVRPHRIDLADVKYIDQEFHGRLRKSALGPGDVVTVRTGKPGTTAVIPDSMPVANCSDLVVTRPGPNLDSRWLSYYLNFVIDSHIGGHLVGAVQQHFNVQSAKKLTLLLPDIAEQRAISGVLGALDDKIAANERIMNITRRLLGANFYALGIDREPLGDMDVVRLSEIVDLNPRESLSNRSQVPYLDMKNLPVVSMTVSSWSYREAVGGARFRNGDTLMARITPCLENGKTGFVDFLPDGQVAVGSTEFIVMRAMGDVPAVLPYFLAKSERFREFAIRHMVGTSGRQRLSANDLRDYPVSRPDEIELRAFGDLSAQLMKRIRCCVDESRLLAHTRDQLLPLLMSGKLRVRDAEPVASGVL